MNFENDKTFIKNINCIYIQGQLCPIVTKLKERRKRNRRTISSLTVSLYIIQELYTYLITNLNTADLYYFRPGFYLVVHTPNFPIIYFIQIHFTVTKAAILTTLIYLPIKSSSLPRSLSYTFSSSSSFPENGFQSNTKPCLHLI